MVLVIAEQQSGTPARASFEAIAAARGLGQPFGVVVPGPPGEASAAAAALESITAGAVVALEHEALRVYTADGYVTALSALIRTREPELLIWPHTYQSRDYVPRLAVEFERPLISDCIAISGSARRWQFTRPLFQGKLNAVVSPSEPGPWFVTVQIGAFADAGDARVGAAQVTTVAATVQLPIRQQPEERFRGAERTVDLARAERVVAAGRGIKDEAGIAIVEALARALGAEIAASRPICDAGWLPMDRQVGSSGQTVAPKLYIALGISGAIQHIVGMRGAKTIVAINTDPHAPIFEIADYGVVGDLFEVVPAMIRALGA